MAESIGDIPVGPETIQLLAPAGNRILPRMSYRLWLIGQIAAGSGLANRKFDETAYKIITQADAIIAQLDAEQEGERG